MENLYYRGKTTWETCCVKNTVTGGGKNIHNRVKKKSVDQQVFHICI